MNSNISKQNTVDLLNEAAENAKLLLPDSPIGNLVSDGGSENCNNLVKDHLKENHKGWKHRIPKLHIRFSNNMMEVWFRLLKNTYLYYWPANSMQELERRLKFYIGEYNSNIPLSSLGGRTPKEAYEGTETIEQIQASLKVSGVEKRKVRLEENLNSI